MLVMIKKTIILKDVMRNTNVKEEIVEWKSIFADFIVIKRNIIWIGNNMIYLWIQEGPQELHSSSRGSQAELLQQVGVLHLYLF